MNPVAHSCWLHGLATDLQYAPSWFVVVAVFTGTNDGERPSKSGVRVIKRVHSSSERTSADGSLKKSVGSYMNQMLNIMS